MKISIALFLALTLLIPQSALHASGIKKIGLVAAFCTFATALIHLRKSNGFYPTLYASKTFNNSDEYLDFLDKKITHWATLSNNSSEEQINSFRKDLIKDYRKVLTNRSISSYIFDLDVSLQPWALLSKEINQHQMKLNGIKSDTLFVCDLINNKYTDSVAQKLKRIESMLNRLEEILISLESQKDYQKECWRIHQDRKLEQIESQLISLVNLYIFFTLTHYLGKVE